MSSERKTEPLRRPERKAGENQARKSQPGSYRGHWEHDPTDPPKAVRMPAYMSIDEAPADLRERAVHKAKLVQRFVNEGCPRGKLEEYARQAALATDMLLDDVPPYTTLRDWAKQYQHWGLLGLVDRVRKDAGRSREVTGETKDLLLACIVGAKHGAAQAISFLSRVLPKGTSLPTYHAMWREIQRFWRENPHLKVMVHDGLAAWRNLFRLALPGREYPAGFRYAVDSTVVDAWVRIRDRDAPEGWKAVRCVLTVVEDVGSRMLLTFNLSIREIDSRIVLGTMRRALVAGENHFGLPVVGLPSEVIVDGGPEHLADFAAAMEAEGIPVERTKRGNPEHNGRVERVIQTVAQEVLANQPGFSPAQRPFNKYRKTQDERKMRLKDLDHGDFQDEIPLMSLNTLDELETKILAWATTYNARTHGSLEFNPEQLNEALGLHELLESQNAA